MSAAKPDTFVDVRWMHAEMECKPEIVQHVLEAKRPELEQVLRFLTGQRQNHLNVGLRFSMWYEESICDGILSNIHPIKIGVSIGILNFRHFDKNGKLIFDAQSLKAEQAKIRRRTAKEELKAQAAINLKHLDDPHFRRAWECYSLAHGSNEFAIGHLYDIREAAEMKFGNAQKVLNLSENEWNRFGKLFNGNSAYGGRHNGKHSAPLRPLSPDEKLQAISFAQKILDAFVVQLELETAAKP